MGLANCNFVAKEETKEAAIAKMKDHHTSAHAEDMKKTGMTNEQLMEKMNRAVKQS